MLRQTTRSLLSATLICATLLAVTGFPQAQNRPRRTLEGLYEVTATRADNGQGYSFLVSLTRESDKWVGAVRDTPFPVTVKEVVVVSPNRLTGSASFDVMGTTVSLTVKVEGNKITCNASERGRAATLTATKKTTAGRGAATIEGTYQGQAEAEGQNTFPIELVIKRMKPSDK